MPVELLSRPQRKVGQTKPFFWAVFVGWRRGRRIFSRSKHGKFPADVGRKSARKSILGVDMILFWRRGGPVREILSWRMLKKKKFQPRTALFYFLWILASVFCIVTWWSPPSQFAGDRTHEWGCARLFLTKFSATTPPSKMLLWFL